MRTPELEALRRRGVSEQVMAMMRLRLAGRSRRETRQALGVTREHYQRAWRRAAAILRERMAVVEQAEYDAERRRVRDVGELLHLIEHDVEEDAVAGTRWRRGAFGQPAGDPIVDDAGRRILPPVRAFVAEDILAAPY